MSRTKAVVHSLLVAPSRGARFVEFLFRRRDADGDIYPEDPAEGVVAGADPDRIVFLGERGELSLGVRTHELSLPAFFARHRSHITRRGVSWSISVLPTSRIQDAPAVVARMSERLQGVDAVVVLVGITDALRVTSPIVWDQNLRETLNALMRALPCGAQVIVGEIPPLDNAGSLSRPARVAAGLQGRLLNMRTRLVARDYPAVVVAGFPDELTTSVWRPESEENRYRNTYKVWGEDLTGHLSADPPVPRSLS
ncbi:hypothetical protein [Frondihabitans sp. 4ASC-45]|uniref:hypothetical protein n=1 Tax=Frondihabitans sp. 4ASC-45 TaxID=3111636 RepID=UPI003C30E378